MVVQRLWIKVRFAWHTPQSSPESRLCLPTTPTSTTINLPNSLCIKVPTGPQYSVLFYACLSLHTLFLVPRNPSPLSLPIDPLLYLHDLIKIFFLKPFLTSQVGWITPSSSLSPHSTSTSVIAWTSSILKAGKTFSSIFFLFNN